MIVTAAQPSEVSVELPELGHGIFTYFLTEGLRGAGDLNRDGIVSLQELYEYVEQQVVRKARAVGGKQNPMMKGEQEGILPLTKVRARRHGRFRAWWRLRRGRLLQMWAVGLVASALVSGGVLARLPRGAGRSRALDLLHQLQGRQQPTDVVIVAIDEAAFEGLGRRQPIPRDYLARVVRGVAKSGAAVVGVDITLRDPDDADRRRRAGHGASARSPRTASAASCCWGRSASEGPLGEAALGPPS